MKSYAILFIGIVLFGCNSQPGQHASPIPKREYSVQSVLWQQKSSEYKALCYQAFNIAKLYLDHEIINNAHLAKPLAIITDIDETVMDNSPYNANMIKTNTEYSKESWHDWGKKEQATSVPGALDFFQYAQSKNVEIFYISNRDEVQKAETISNLQKLGFPGADSTHLLLKDNTSKKQPRRDVVLNSHKVIMYLGDNLGDFSELFDGLDRSTNLDSVKYKFGFEFIVLPNPMYGDWESKEIYQGKFDWSSHQKDSIRKSHLRAY